MKTTFWGKSLEFKSTGFQHAKLKSTQEHFTVERPNSACCNIIFGEMYIDHYGKMTIKNQQTGDYAEIDFKKRGWSAKSAHEVEGYIYSPKKEKKFKIWGKWTESLTVKNLMTGDEEKIWVANPMPPEANRMSHFTFFTLQLNHLPESLRQKLPPTDSRLRPD